MGSTGIFLLLIAHIKIVNISKSIRKMAGKFSEDQVAEIRESFKKMDVDGNGTITSQEMRNFFDGWILSGPEIEVMAEMADANGDGKLNYEEFLQMMIKAVSN